MHISHKVLKRKAKGRRYAEIYTVWKSDESAANEQTRFRKRGWAAYGLSPIITQPVKRSERWGILLAYNIHGILAWHIYQGSSVGNRS